MDDRVKAEYEALVTKAVIRHGNLVDKSASLYGWMDQRDDYESGSLWGGGPRHIVSCGVASTGKVVEDATWYEFAGTFAEGDNYKHGMEVHGVTCNCGRLTDRVYRWDANPGEAIRTVLEALLEEKIGGIPEGCCGQELCVFDDRGSGQKGPCRKVEK